MGSSLNINIREIMDTVDYQFYGTVIAIIGIIFAVIKGWLKQSERISAINERTLALEKDIEEYKSNTNSDIAGIKNDRSHCRKDIYARIDEVVKMKDVDIKELTAAIAKSIEKYSDREDQHHDEVMAKIEGLAVRLSAMNATFEEYRKK